MSLPDEPARFRAGPLIGPQYCIEIGMRNDRVALHYRLNRSPNRREIAPLLQEGFDRDLISRIQDRGQRSPGFTSPSGQVQSRKIVIPGRRKLELRNFAK